MSIKVNDETYRYYFYFIQERMNIFWKRYEGKIDELTNDDILARNKFTNVYRAQDRVSQYLIRSVIYNGKNYSEEDILLRIIVFKIFNNIDTWEFLEQRMGQVNIETFQVEDISGLLKERIKTRPIFNGAYMMTGSHKKYSIYDSKHEKWLWMVRQELIDKAFKKILKARSLKEVYNHLEGCSFLGPFLAYQYAIDLNYSPVIDFDENSFVRAGIGAIRGIKKCFLNASVYAYEDYIIYTQENFLKFQEKYGHTGFRDLFGRQPTLIDLQNCFCETDKYLRVKMPELQVDNTRIKQKFKNPKGKINFFFPPKWDINKSIEQ